MAQELLPEIEILRAETLPEFEASLRVLITEGFVPRGAPIVFKGELAMLMIKFKTNLESNGNYL